MYAPRALRILRTLQIHGARKRTVTTNGSGLLELREGKPLKLTATIGARPPEEKLAQSNFNPEENKDFDKQTDTPDSKVIRDKLGLSVIPLGGYVKMAGENPTYRERYLE